MKADRWRSVSDAGRRCCEGYWVIDEIAGYLSLDKACEIGGYRKAGY